MIITKKALPRRTFLRGAGVTLALPFLDAMIPSFSDAAAVANPVRRLGFVYIPMGCNWFEFFPKEVGKITELSPTLSTLTPFLNQVTVISNLELKNSYSPGNHATSNSGFLSAARAKMTEGADYELATTVDQIAAKQLGKETRLPSLELAVDATTPIGACDGGMSCIYETSLSWSSPTTPLPAEANPRVVFERLFGDGGSASDRLAALREDGSLIDFVSEDIANVQRKLGAGDRTKLSQYLESVREIERRIQKAESDTAKTDMPDLTRPIGAPSAYGDHAKLMFDLQVLAMQADITRIITFQLAREASTRTYPEVGVSEAHHPTSHHGNDPEKLAKLAKINAYHVSLFAHYIERLNSTPDGDGTLLDHSMILLGSGMGNPDVHNHVNLPIVVAGGGKGKLKGGRHIKYQEPTPLANLHLTLLEKAGIHLDTFADSKGRVDELLSL
ncbi:MAG: hypothetical protein C5B51_12210 [Terriglobia bacterium]|nr:MAG: hypothetical protein C5B51_12210 [Terriglobia bacterium]